MAVGTDSGALKAIALSVIVVLSGAGIGIVSVDTASAQEGPVSESGLAQDTLDQHANSDDGPPNGGNGGPPGEGNGGPPDGDEGGPPDRGNGGPPENGNGPPSGQGPPTTIDSCTVIDTPGRYFLGDDVRTEGSGPCIRITSSNVVLDGKRNTIAGTRPRVGHSVAVLAGETGPNSTTLSGVTVRNLFVDGTSTGVAFENVRNGVVQASVFSGHFVGVRLTGTDARNNRIAANQFTGTTRGLSIEWARNNMVVGNHGSNNLIGVYLSHASGNLIRGNTIVGNNEAGIALEDESVGNEIRNNSVWDNDQHPIRKDNSSRENADSENDEEKPAGPGRGRGVGRGLSDASPEPAVSNGAAGSGPAALRAGDGAHLSGIEGSDGLRPSLSTATSRRPAASARSTTGPGTRVGATDGAGVTAADLNAAASTAVSFNASGLGNVSLAFPTSLQFGPDGRLYVAEQYGDVHALTVEQNASGGYEVTDSELITKIKNIPNHDDDGSLNTSVNSRLVTGLLVAGTAENPVVYVGSSDPRIGGGEDGTDTPVDTNSGIVSRLTWNGTAWNHTELVRGLPRSEENHGPNGMALDESSGTLYVTMGGNTNKGAPSNNFAYLPEYAYSAAILTVNLTAIGDTTYDLPTLQNTTTPFGGQGGDNMAKIVSDSPVQVYSSGYRNPYDVVLTEDDQLYTIDNGANSGWGGPPVNEGAAGECTNEPNENNSESVFDSLHYIPSEGFYAGHPNPVRGNPDGSGYPGAVPAADPVQCDFIAPGNADDSLTKFAASTNGIDEYTASTFDGAMQGDLLAAGFSGNVWRLQLTSDGTALSSKSALFSNFGSKPLDVTTQGDDQVFPGTIWAATYGSNAITVFEPNENFACTGADNPAIDEDGDGYSNADEIDAGTNPCSEASAPADHDRDDFSDLNDYDDDNDGWSDTSDPFAIDADNGLGTALPVTYDLAPGSEEGTILDLGFTGLMTNGEDDYRDLYDPGKLTAGGAANVLTVDAITEGDAYRANNDQRYGFQFGVDPAGQRFTVHSEITGPFSNGTAVVDNRSQGIFLGNGDQDNYVKLVAGAKGGSGGIHLLREVDGTTTSVAYPTVANVTGSGVTIDLYMTVDPRNDTVTGAYTISGSTPVTVGTTTVPGNWLSSDQRGLATGAIGTSRGSGDPFPGTWKRIEASEGTVLSGNQPPAAAFDYAPVSPAVDESVTFDATAATDDDGSVASYAWDVNGDGTAEYSGQQASHTYTTTGERTVTLTVTDDDGATDTTSQTVNVTDGERTVVSEDVTSCGVIDSPGRYTLTTDLLNSTARPCLQVTASDVILDGDGHTLDADASANGSTLRAVYVGQTGLNPGTISNVTVRDLVLTDWSEAVYYRRASGGDVLGNRIDNSLIGVRFAGDAANQNHVASANRINGTGSAIVLEGSSDSQVTDNRLSGNGDAIELLAAGNSVVTNNTATATVRSAIRLESAGPDNEVTNLTVDGTTVSFTGRNVSVGPVTSPPVDPDGENNIGKRVDAAATGTDAFLDVSVRYTDADLGFLNESTLSMWAYDDAWTELPGRPHVDTTANLVSVNTTQFGVLTPLADEKPVVYRVNAGGPTVSSVDGDLDWSADTVSSPSPYTNQDGANSKTFETTDPIQVNDSVPSSTPADVFRTERWDPTSEGEMQWDFPVTAGATYEVRLYFAEIYFESVDQRIFNATLEMEGTPVLADYDIYADVGHDTGVMKSFTVTPDDTLDIDFAHVTQNPKLSAIEIVKTANATGNAAPTASFTYSPSSPGVNETVTFDASGSGDSDGSISSYEWDVDGDGTAEYSGQQVSHTYTSAGDRTVTLTVTDSDGATDTTSQTVTVSQPESLTSEAEVTVLSGSNNINVSTYASGSFTVTNTGEANITTVRFNLSTAKFPDMVFDPNGTAGDIVAKNFTPDSEGGTGLLDHSFQSPHDGDPNNGYDALEITFTEFEPGETFAFSVDVDPTTIKGDSAPGPYESGSVSGLELARSEVTVSFENGAEHVGTLFSDGSLGGSVGVVKNDSAPAPTLDVRNVSLGSTTLSPDHVAATVTNASQTVAVTGSAGATVRLLRVEGGQFTEGVPNGGYDVEAFEANSAVVVDEQTVTLGSDGVANASVTLTNSTSEVSDGTAGYNYFVAVVEDADGDAGLVSDVVVLRYNDTASGSTASLASPSALFTGTVWVDPSARTASSPAETELLWSARSALARAQ